MKKLSAWILAARPKTLLASVGPVAMGAALAVRDGGFHAPAALAALLGAITIQVGTNFCNDYFDHRQGADTADRQGPTRAVQAGWVSPGQMLAATVGMFALTAAICVYLVGRAGWPLALLGAVSILSGIGYTASRFSLAYLGLGDLFVLAFFGPIAVAGTHYVQTLQFSPAAAVAGLAPGFLAVAILVVNNLRDIREDAAAGKRTLAVRFGANFARGEYIFCLLAAAAIPLLLWQRYGFPARILAASASLLPGSLLAAQVVSRSGPQLNPLLGRTAALLLLFAFVFSAICVIR